MCNDVLVSRGDSSRKHQPATRLHDWRCTRIGSKPEHPSAATHHHYTTHNDALLIKASRRKTAQAAHNYQPYTADHLHVATCAQPSRQKLARLGHLRCYLLAPPAGWNIHNVGAHTCLHAGHQLRAEATCNTTIGYSFNAKLPTAQRTMSRQATAHTPHRKTESQDNPTSYAEQRAHSEKTKTAYQDAASALLLIGACLAPNTADGHCLEHLQGSRPRLKSHTHTHNTWQGSNAKGVPPSPLCR